MVLGDGGNVAWRPKLLWRLSFPVLFVAGVWVAGLDAPAAGLSLGAVGIVGSAVAWTRRLILSGSELRRRGLFVDPTPEVDTTSIVLVSLSRDGGDRWPARKLRIADAYGNRIQLEPWFWPRAAVRAVSALQ